VKPAKLLNEKELQKRRKSKLLLPPPLPLLHLLLQQPEEASMFLHLLGARNHLPHQELKVVETHGVVANQVEEDLVDPSQREMEDGQRLIHAIPEEASVITGDLVETVRAEKKAEDSVETVKVEVSVVETATGSVITEDSAAIVTVMVKDLVVEVVDSIEETKESQETEIQTRILTETRTGVEIEVIEVPLLLAIKEGGNQVKVKAL
jgi:hypothetical protein